MSTINQILAETGNRQYPLPQKNWKYFQEWHHTIFFHWEVPVYFLEDHIPEGLHLDTFKNTAWVTLAAFEVKNMRMRHFPPVPYVSNFQEINIRTYVTKNGIPGIYLFSIETDKFIEVLFSNIFIGLPYQKSVINRASDQIQSINKELEHLLDIKIGATSSLKKTALDLWLTERHSLYEICSRKLCRFDVHHKEWELRNIDVTINDILYDAGNYTINIYPDIIQYAEKLEVVLWEKEKIE